MSGILRERRDTHSAERCLWLAVLGEMLMLDLRERDPVNLPGPAGDWRQARDWAGSDDFRDVCRLAGLDPDFVQRHRAAQLRVPVGQRRLETLKLRSISSAMDVIRKPRRGVAA